MYIHDGRQVGSSEHRQTWRMIRSMTMRAESAGRHIDRSGVKYKSTSHSEYTYMAYQYIIYIDTDLYLVRILFICRPADPAIILLIYRQIDRSAVKYRYQLNIN